MSSFNTINKIKLDFEYNNEVFNFDAEPFRTLNEMKEKVIRKIYHVPKGIHCYYKNRDLTPYLFERLETLFPRKQKVLVKLKEPQKQRAQATFSFINSFNGIEGSLINSNDNNIINTKTSLERKKRIKPSFHRKSLLEENNFQYDVNSMYNNYVNISNNINAMNTANNINNINDTNNMNDEDNQNIDGNVYAIPDNKPVRNCADEFISNNLIEINTCINNNNSNNFQQQDNKQKMNNNLDLMINDNNHNFFNNPINTNLIPKINTEPNNINYLGINKKSDNSHDSSKYLKPNLIKSNKTSNKNDEKLKKLYLKCHVCSQNVISHFCRNCFIFICESCKLKCEEKSHKVMRINVSNPNFFSNVDDYVQKLFDEMEEKRNIVSSSIAALNPQTKVKGKNKDKKNAIPNIDAILKKLVKMINKLSYLYKEIMGILSTINLKKADQVEEDFNEEVSDLKDNISEILSKAEVNLANFNAFPTIHDQYTAMKFYFRKIHDQENKYINDICPKVKIYTLGYEINKNVTEGCEKMETILEGLVDQDNTFGLDKYYLKEYKDLVKDCELNLGVKRPQMRKYSLSKGNKRDNVLMITNVYSNLYAQRLSIGGKAENVKEEDEGTSEKNGGNE